MISKEMTTELKEILLQEFNKDISSKEASMFGNALVNYISLITKIDEANRKDKDDQPTNE